MKKIKEFLDLVFLGIIICLGFIVIVNIGENVYKNIVISNKINKIKKDSVCLIINGEIYCRLDYDIKIEYNLNKA